MSQFFNQNSAVLLSAALVLIVAVFIFRRKARWQDFLALGVIVAALAAAWVILHPVQTPLMEDAKKVRAMIGGGAPVLLEFQSPY